MIRDERIKNLLLRELEKEKLKDDRILSTKSISPVVHNEGLYFSFAESQELSNKLLDKNGTRSYLEKIAVPSKFYNKCSIGLKTDMVKEFHSNVNTQDKHWTVRMLGDKIRFVASDQYGVFDNLDVFRSLHDIGIPDDTEIKELHMDDDYLVLRIAQKKPIMMAGRPFFAGLQFSNSEVGLGSARGSLMLWERICTNGLTVPVKSLGKFNIVHLGENRRERMLGSLEKITGKFQEFVDMAAELLTTAGKEDGKDLLATLSKKRSVDSTLFAEIEDRLEGYAKNPEEPLYIDVISAYTEAIQKLSWSERFEHEEHAGKLLLELIK